jgi:aspartate kinase
MSTTSSQEKPFVVQKFGGTSLGVAERLAAVVEIVRESQKTVRPLLVVSALSAGSKAQGTTSLLLAALSAASARTDFSESLKRIGEFHSDYARAVLEASRLPAALEFIELELGRVRTVLEAINILGQCTPQAQDLVLACGERFSAYFVSVALTQAGIAARMLDLASVAPLGIEDLGGRNLELLRKAFALQVAECEQDQVLVATGFFGPLDAGLLQLVGRGYSDFAAALLAAAIGAERVRELQIWKEVDGVCTADPRRVPAARVLAQLSGREAAELTFFGSEVIHPFTMEQVISRGIPIRVRNTLNPAAAGTLILPEVHTVRPGASALTGKRGVCVLLISSNKMYNACGFLAAFFEVLKRHKIVVDLISTSETGVSCTVDPSAVLDVALDELRQLGDVSLTSQQSIISVVGEALHAAPALAGRMLAVLAQVTPEIHMITQSSTRLNISCVIPEQALDRAMQAVHAELIEKA